MKNPAAQNEFESTAKDIEKLLKIIKEDIKKLRKQAKEEGMHWGHVGSLNEIREKLILIAMNPRYTIEDPEETIRNQVLELLK